MSRQPFLAIPAAEERPRLVAMSVFFLTWFVALFGGADWLSGLVPWRISVGLPFEAQIPFLPAMSFVYLSLDALLLMTPFVLRTWKELAPLFAALVAETAVAAIVFVALPVATDLPPIPTVDGVVGMAFAVADRLNLDRNLLPSLHVAYGVTVAFGLSAKASRSGRFVLFGWAGAIAASTVLLRQHFVLDVVAGALLGWASWRIVGQWAQRPSVLRAFDVELLCLENQLRFVRRHRRYLVITLALWAASVPRWRRRRVLRTGFCALQAIDDLLDGDRSCDGEPLDVVDDLLAQIDARSFAHRPLERLLAAFVEDLEQAGGPEALDQALELIHVMQRDRLRQRDGLLFDEGELAEHHRRTFTLSLDLMLLAGGGNVQNGEVRAGDVPDLADALGWCSTVRDLEDDLRRGLINLPAGVVEAARNEVGSDEPLDWANSPAVRDWLEQERCHTLARLGAVDQELEVLQGRDGVRVLKRFARSVRRYAERPVAGSSVSAWHDRVIHIQPRLSMSESTSSEPTTLEVSGPGLSTQPCANCGEAAGPQFCPHCGQELTPRHGPLWSVGRELLSDWMSLDSRLLRSLRALLVPGRLSNLYLNGQRAPFLRPFRLYLLASLLLFSTALTLKAPDASTWEITIGGQRVGGPAGPTASDDSEIQVGSAKAKVKHTLEFLGDDSFVGRFLLYLAGDRIDRLRDLPPQQAVDQQFAGLRRTLPVMLILFVPLLALGLKLLYVRRRGAHHLYLEHFVFAVHYQAALFLALSVAWLVARIARFELTGSLISAAVALVAILFVYLPWGLRNFYGQSRRVTALKTFAVLYLYSQLLGLIVGVSTLVGIWNI